MIKVDQSPVCILSSIFLVLLYVLALLPENQTLLMNWQTMIQLYKGFPRHFGDSLVQAFWGGSDRRSPHTISDR